MKDERSIMGLQEIEELIEQANYNQALKEIAKLTQGETLDGRILKTRILTRQGELNDTLTVAKEAVQESEQNGTENQKLKAKV